MSIEESIRQIIREENKRLLEDIKSLLDSHVYQEAPKTLSVREAAAILGFGVTKTYEMIQRAEFTRFPYIRDGRIIRVPYNALMNWIDKQTYQ